jgi:hypothetical protein
LSKEENLHVASITPEFGYGKLSRKPFVNENVDVAQVEETKGIVGYTWQAEFCRDDARDFIRCHILAVILQARML